MKTVARLRHLGVPPLKVRRYARTIKGESVDRALAILDLQPSPTCQALHKLLKSAIANARNNHELLPDYLYVSNVLVDQGPSMKRIKPRARGRAYRILRRSSHVTIEVALKPGISVTGAGEEEQEKAKARKRAPRRKAAEAKAEKKPAAKTAAKPRKRAPARKPKPTEETPGEGKTTEAKAEAKPRRRTVKKAVEAKTETKDKKTEEKPKRAPRRTKADEAKAKPAKPRAPRRTKSTKGEDKE